VVLAVVGAVVGNCTDSAKSVAGLGAVKLAGLGHVASTSLDHIHPDLVVAVFVLDRMSEVVVVDSKRYFVEDCRTEKPIAGVLIEVEAKWATDIVH